MSLHFDELFRKKLQKVPHFVKKHKNSPIWPKLCNFFEQTTMFWCFDEILSESLQKVAQFVRKHEKSLIWPKLWNFSKQTTMSLHFDEVFRKKLQKVPHFVKKQEKSSIWPNLCNFSKKLPCLCISMNFSEKSCKKCRMSWESTRNHPFGQIFATFWRNYHVFAFRWTFQQKVAKSASFREKARNAIDFPKTFNFSSKLPCPGIFMNFSARRWKKCLISWKTTTNHRFGENLQLFEQTTMSWHFHELFKKKLQKVRHFVKKHEKSSISPKLATFRKNYHVFTFWWTLWQKLAKTAPFREKARKIIDLAKTMQLFRTNYHVFAFRWTFKEKVAKSASFRDEARKTIDLAKTFNFSSKLPCLGIFMNFSARTCKKCLIPWKSTRNHRFGQNYATFSNKLPCLCISINFSGKSCKKSLISWNSTKNHWFGQSFATFGTSYNVFFLLTNFQENSCKKCVVSWKSTKNKRFSQPATFRENYHV